jgi:hypothetical protein
VGDGGVLAKLARFRELQVNRVVGVSLASWEKDEGGGLKTRNSEGDMEETEETEEIEDEVEGNEGKQDG